MCTARSLLVLLSFSASVSLTACSERPITTSAKSRDLGGFVVGEMPDLRAAASDAAAPKDFAGAGPDVDLAMPPANNCGMVTYAGFCTGSEVTWCEAGSLQTYDCAKDGKACTVVNGDADCR